MQRATNSVRPAEDIHAILSRFQTWAGKQPENGNRQNAAGVREIPMEEAMRQLRSRRAKPPVPTAEQTPAPQPPVVPAARKAKAAAEPKPVPVIQTVVSTPTATSVAAPVRKTKPVPTAKPVVNAQPAPAQAKNVPAAEREAAPQVKARPEKVLAQKKPRKLGKRKPRDVRKAAKQKRLVAPPSRVRKAGAKRQPPFREVLARSVRAETPVKQHERRQRVSVRLSSAEERRLQQRAQQAGVTISEYLRRSALEAKTSGLAGRSGKQIRSRHGRSATAGPPFAHATSQSSTLGGWISLLRHRFLASPARFAERA